jgi:hypothetical protein
MPRLGSQASVVGYLDKDGTSSHSNNSRDGYANIQIAKHSMPIFNARLKNYTLDSNGFQLVNFTPTDGDLADKETSWRFASKKKKLKFMLEATEVIKRAAGASLAIPVQTHIRNGDASSFMSGFSAFAHCDVGDDFLLDDQVGNSAFDALQIVAGISKQEALKYDISLYSLWQPIYNPVLKNPLILLDWNTIMAKDIVPIRPEHKTSDWHETAGKKRLTQITMPSHNPQHEWCCFPQVSTSEVMIYVHALSLHGLMLHLCYLRRYFSSKSTAALV